MSDRTLFFYGTLMAPPVLHRVIFGNPHPSALDHPNLKNLVVRPALLHGYSRRRVRHADYPAIIPEEDGLVRGSLVTGLTEGDVWRLDIFEGDQYRRGKVGVKILEGVALDEAADVTAEKTSPDPKKADPAVKGEAEEVTAETYIWKDDVEELESQEWDFDEFKRDKMKAWMGVAEWGDEDDETDEAVVGGGVVVDDGFALVDEAVAEKEKVATRSTPNGTSKDPTGGRGANGNISKQLLEAQRSPL